jgi:hypothetical protein
MKSRLKRIGIRSRRGLGLARVPVGSGPAGDFGSLDRQIHYKDIFFFNFHIF